MTRQSSPRFSRNKTWISQLCFPLVCAEPLLTSLSQGASTPMGTQISCLFFFVSYIPVFVRFTLPFVYFTPHVCHHTVTD